MCGGGGILELLCKTLWDAVVDGIGVGGTNLVEFPAPFEYDCSCWFCLFASCVFTVPLGGGGGGGGANLP